MISDTLKALLVHCKSARLLESDELDFVWDRIAKVLGPLYSSDMKLLDVMYIVTKAYTEAVNERRFCMRGTDCVLCTVMLAPVQGTASIDMLGPINGIETKYSVEQFYNAMLSRMLNDLRFTKIDWLRDTPEGEFLNNCSLVTKIESEKGKENEI